MNNSKDFSDLIPKWGPYSKKYMGISRIVDDNHKSGVRFDLTVHPTLANTNVPVPNVTVPSNYHPWSCNNNLTHFSYRYDLEWKDKVYADVSFTKIYDEAFLIRTEFVNNTEFKQIAMLNIFGALEYPNTHYCKVVLPKKNIFINAVDYKNYTYAQPRPWDSENPDGMEKGVFIDPLFSGNKGLGDRIENYHIHFLNLKPFGAAAGDRVTYEIDCNKDFYSSCLVIRYKTVGDAPFASFNLNGYEIKFPKANSLSLIQIPLGRLIKGKIILDFIANGAAGIELDFLTIVENVEKDVIQIKNCKYQTKPKITIQKLNNSEIAAMNFNEIGQTYSIITNSENTRYRELETGVLEDALISRLSNGDVTFDELTHTFTSSFSDKKSDDGYFFNPLIHSIFIEPNSSHIEYAVIAKDTFSPLSNDEYEEIYNIGKSALSPLKFNKLGQKYSLSNEILRATALTNVVYPIYRHGEYIVHHTPGKRWDSLYTWDSGFIALGLLETEPRLSEYILNTYFAETDNKDFAFLHHGSLVPVQFYQYLEMLKRANNKDNLLSYYSRAKRYYDFISGKAEGSATAKFKSGLTTTYDYFYSSSGMDDYPAQQFMIKNKLQKYACPCISTSQVIRCAKIMKMLAAALNLQDDINEYDNDISHFTNAIQSYAWDNESGYFSYVIHNDNNEPIGFFKTSNGENLNKGIDGIYPLIAGTCTKEQKERILSHLKNEMWSSVGISAVDMTASYFLKNGYWNGNIWFSHQWFIWKTMLDLGETDFAFKIADTALNSWKKEVDHTYYTFEMLNIETGRGGWFHHFGGLSMPINIWANAYYKPGTLSSGLDVWIESQNFNNDKSEAEINFNYFGNNDKYSFITILNDNYKYNVTLNDKKIDFNERQSGLLEITLNGNIKNVNIKINKM